MEYKMIMQENQRRRRRMYDYDEKKVVVAHNINQQLEELIKAVEETPDAITLAFQGPESYK